MFLQMIEGIVSHVVADGQNSLDFQREGVFLHIYIQFWRNDELCKVFLCRTGRIRCQISLIANVAAAVPTKLFFVCCTGSTTATLSLLDECNFTKLNKLGVQGPLRFQHFSLEKLMHKCSYSVFGCIDFFSVLQHLVISLGGCLDLEWTLLAPTLTKVISFLINRRKLKRLAVW